MFELDHAFVWTPPGAAAGAAALAGAGLIEGAGNVHASQGTANRRWFFDNFMLELLWVDAAVSADGPQLARTGLIERWQARGHGANPFGFCLRAREGQRGAPFPGWRYTPPYLPEPYWIWFAETPRHEPALFYAGLAARATARVVSPQRPAQRELRTLRAARLFGPQNETPSAAFGACLEAGWITLSDAREWLLELEFAEPLAGPPLDLRPALPLRLRGG